MNRWAIITRPYGTNNAAPSAQWKEIPVMKRSAQGTVMILTAALLLTPSAGIQPAELSVADYATLQAAIDANPGRMLFVPAGDYPI
jgi:hypothetical protein